MIDITYISSILSNPTWDILVIFFFIAGGFFYGLSVGKRKLIAVLFGIYAGQLLFENLNILNFIVDGRDLIEVFLFRVLTFAVIVLLLSYLFIKTIFRGGGDDTKIWWQIFLMSFLESGLLISSVFRLLPESDLFNFSPIVHYFFASQGAFFWWLILPLPALFVIMRKRKD